MKNNVFHFLKIVERDYPEKFIQLLEVEYEESDLESFINHVEVENFNVLSFKKSLLPVFKYTTNTLHSSNPVIGEIALDNTSGNISVFDGSIWQPIQH